MKQKVARYVNTIKKLPFVASNRYPLKDGPNGPETNPYAVKIRPKIAPKCFRPKQSDAKGAETAKSVPKAKPIIAASRAEINKPVT